MADEAPIVPDFAGAAPPLEAIVEAILFAAERPMSSAEVHHAVATTDGTRGIEEYAVRAALDVVATRYAEAAGRGIALVQVGERFQFRTGPAVGPWVARATGLRPTRLSRAALETLAIVAYRQPCTRGDVERVRGVDSGGVLRALLDRKLLRIAGRRNDPGRPIVYATSRAFLDTFGLGALEDLPSLREFTLLGDVDMEAVADLFDDGEEQVTFEDFAHRQARSELDSAVDARLAAGLDPQQTESEQP